MTLGLIRKFSEGFDPSQPGAIDDLLAFHRDTFGGARMVDGDGDKGDAGKAGNGDGDGKTGNGDGDGKTGDKAAGKQADEPHEGERLASEFAEARTGRKAAEQVIVELTGKTVTQVRKALRTAKGDAAKAVEALGGADSTQDAGKAGEVDDRVDPEKVRREAEAKAEDAANARIVRSEVRALAGETFANPRDALTNLDLDDYEVDEDGELVDPAKVKTDLAAVLKTYPHYARKKNPAADRGQGRAGSSGDRPTSIRELSRIRVED